MTAEIKLFNVLLYTMFTQYFLFYYWLIVSQKKAKYVDKLWYTLNKN